MLSMVLCGQQYVAPAPVGDILLLLHGDNSSNALLDSSNYTRTETGSSAVTYNSSGNFNGCLSIGSYVYWTIAQMSSQSLSFCSEFYIKIPSYPLGHGAACTVITFGKYLTFRDNALTMIGDGATDITAAGITVNTWAFIRLVKDTATNTVKLYVDGALVGSTAYSNNNFSNVFEIDKNGSVCLFDEVRVSINGALGAGIPTFPLSS